MSRNIQKQSKIPISYLKLFWLFMIGSLLGVILEGLFCYFRYGNWETHVVSIWGPFCILYGFGAVGFYVCHVILCQKNKYLQFFIYCIIGFTIELLGGYILEFGLHMRAWNYTDHFLNFRGYVSLQMTILWGLVGTAFSYFAPSIEKVLQKMESGKWKVACYMLTVFMTVNFLLTSVSILRWKDRHFDIPAQNTLEQFIDRTYNDDFMSNRFCEWSFLK